MQVQGRIQKKPALVRKFDAQLRKIGFQARLRFGEKELTSDFLGESTEYLFTVKLHQLCMESFSLLFIFSSNAVGSS